MTNYEDASNKPAKSFIILQKVTECRMILQNVEMRENLINTTQFWGQFQETFEQEINSKIVLDFLVAVKCLHLGE